MSTIYHKGGKSLPLPNPLYSVRNEMIMAPNKTMAPLQLYPGYYHFFSPSVTRTMEKRTLSQITVVSMV